VPNGPPQTKSSLDAREKREDRLPDVWRMGDGVGGRLIGRLAVDDEGVKEVDS
jgi:hypothetical protein